MWEIGYFRLDSVEIGYFKLDSVEIGYFSSDCVENCLHLFRWCGRWVCLSQIVCENLKGEIVMPVYCSRHKTIVIAELDSDASVLFKA